MAFQAAVNSLSDILQRHPWAEELAGILPLSALIDFIDVPRKLHALQLAGGVSLWSWVITPAGSRLLLADPPEFGRTACVLDRFGSTVGLEVLDGRYGERYFSASPETLRLLLASLPLDEVVNDHANMAERNLRTQTLELVHVSRRPGRSQAQHLSEQGMARRLLRDARLVADPICLATIVLGWSLLVGMLVMSAFLETWISFAFYLLIPTTGLVVFALHGSRPRRLLVDRPSDYIRLLLISEHMNSAEWIVVYGESSIVNSLLNRPLEPTGAPLSAASTTVSRFLLRTCIIGQWALVLAAAATKDWNAYFICFWVSFSIFSQAYLLTPTRVARAWARELVNLKFERLSTRLSSRRSLLNAVVALNPDSFSRNEAGAVNLKQFNAQGLRWIDPILQPSDNRSRWEEATRQAMEECHTELSAEDVDLSLDKYRGTADKFLSSAWNDSFSQQGNYWRDCIAEGLYVASKLRKAKDLPTYKVPGVD
ncbi:hypothetical protein FQN49_007037 [Arthroderma sp. PD_2]|nr:hypothetical protein FQN49_007037 [Arthroderma sp. PD_2]